MITPFVANHQIDWPALDELIEWYLHAGVSGLFAVCLSSEMFALSWEERLAVARRTVERSAGRVPVVAAGIVDMASELQADHIKQMADTGVGAVVCVANQLAGEEDGDSTLRSHVESLLRQTGDVPLGFYECPHPCHRVLTADFLGWAASTGRFVFMKDTCGDIDLITAKIAAIRGTPLRLLNADSRIVLETMLAGADGYSSIGANFYPSLFVWLCRHFRTQRKLAESLQQFLAATNTTLLHKYPVSAKVFLRQHGVSRIMPHCRVCDESLTATEVESLAEIGRVAVQWHEKLHNQPDAHDGCQP